MSMVKGQKGSASLILFHFMSVFVFSYASSFETNNYQPKFKLPFIFVYFLLDLIICLIQNQCKFGLIGTQISCLTLGKSNHIKIEKQLFVLVIVSQRKCLIYLLSLSTFATQFKIKTIRYKKYIKKYWFLNVMRYIVYDHPLILYLILCEIS